MITRCQSNPGLLGTFLFFIDFWPNPGPGRLPLDSGREDVELARVFASAATLADFVSECMFANPVEIKVSKYARARVMVGNH